MTIQTVANETTTAVAPAPEVNAHAAQAIAPADAPAAAPVEMAPTAPRERQVQVKNPKAEELTFGIEIECFVPRGCMRVGARHAGIEIGGSAAQAQLEWPAGWRAESDGSLSCTVANYMPVEIVSPILRGADGIAQIRRVGEILARLDARVNTTCGFHYVQTAIMWS